MENKNALFVIDMQEDYIGEKSRCDYYSDSLIEHVNERIRTAEREGQLVIYVRNKGRRNKQEYVSPFAPGLLVVSDYCFEKGRASAFSEETLVNLLRDKEIEAIEVIGIDGNCCVAATALEAKERGLAVRFPLQYVGIKSMQRFERTREKLVKAGVQVI